MIQPGIIMKKFGKKNCAKRFLLLSALLLAALIPCTVFAGSSETNDIGFYVKAHIPDNQIDRSLTYFDLHMQPAKKQSLAVSVFNTMAESITVEISAISASTNQNGIIDYRTKDIRDDTLLHPFSDLADVAHPVITIPGFSEETAYIDIVMPEDEYDGVILGGIVIAQKKDIQTSKTQSDQGSSIINQYAYILGVKLSETEAIVTPAFELANVAAETIDYRPALVHCLRNTEAAIVKEMDVSVKINQLDSEKLLYEDQWVIDMAPNSMIRLPAFIDSSSLAPGIYRSQATLNTDGNVTILEYTFTIEREQVKNINRNIIEESDDSSLWIWIISFLLIIIVILIILLIILFKRRNREERTSDQ